MLRYDEAALRERLDPAPARARALFAALGAERLFPLYEHFAQRTGQGDPDKLRAALDAAWAALDGDAGKLARWEDVAMGLVPDEDDDAWEIESAYAENAAAAVAYALRTRATGDLEPAIWTALQAYEATDFAAQRLLEPLTYTDPGGEDALRGHPVVQEALAGINTDLAAATENPPAEEIPRLRAHARQGGEMLAGLVRVSDVVLRQSAIKRSE